MTASPPIPAPRVPAMTARTEGDETDEFDDLLDDRLADAHVEIRERRFRPARQMLLAMLRDHPDSVAALTLLAVVSTVLGDAGGTLQFADAALRIAPGQPKLLAMRATALSALGRRAEARQAADAAIAYEPRSAEPYAARAGVDLTEHSPSGYAAVLDIMVRARHAVLGPSPYALTLTARYARALDGLGAAAHARTVLGRLIREHPNSPSLRIQAAELESGAWRWRRTVEHLARLLSSPDGSALITNASRRCATAVRLWLVELAGTGALLTVASVAAQTWLAPAGAALAVAIPAAYVGLVVASIMSLAAGRRVVARIIVRSPGAITAGLLIAAMLAGQIVSLVRVNSLTRGELVWLLAAAVVLGFGAVTDVVVRLSGVVGHRYKAWRNRERIAAARAIESTRLAVPACILYPVDVPTPGRLSLSGMPAERSARNAVLRGFGPCGVDVVVSTLRADLSEDGRGSGSAGVEFIVFPIEAGRPPRGPAFDLLVATVIARLRAGSSVALVCRTGAERGALVAAAVCVQLGLSPETAWSHVEQSRQVPLAVSPAQRVWLDRYARRVGHDQHPAVSNQPDARSEVAAAALPAAR
jgi:tetratricopeptide (TPR) repeat protein